MSILKDVWFFNSIATGGKQVRVKGDNSIYCYSSEGEQKIN